MICYDTLQTNTSNIICTIYTTTTTDQIRLIVEFLEARQPQTCLYSNTLFFFCLQNLNQRDYLILYSLFIQNPIFCKMLFLFCHCLFSRLEFLPEPLEIIGSLSGCISSTSSCKSITITAANNVVPSKWNQFLKCISQYSSSLNLY